MIGLKPFIRKCSAVLLVSGMGLMAASCQYMNRGVNAVSHSIRALYPENPSAALPSEWKDTVQDINPAEEDPALIRASHEAGFCGDSMTLRLESSEGKIVYTLDGSTPGPESPELTEPLLITKPTVVRAAVRNENGEYLQGYTATFLPGFSTVFPVLSLSTDEGSLYNSDTGIFAGARMADSSVVATAREHNFFRKIERKVQVEFFESDGKRVICQQAGIRVFGGLTRMFPEKSLRIIAREKYGKKRFRHRFFPDRENTSFKSLVVRTSGNDYRSTRFRDMLITRLAEPLGIDVQAGRTIVLFMNGEYRGIYHLREKIDEHYLEDNFGADSAGTDILQACRTVEYGSDDAYDSLLNYVRRHDLSDEAHFEAVEGMMDIENYTNYILTELYINNLDARGNIRFWRASNLDRKFRWILYDTDHGFGLSMPVSGNFLRAFLHPEDSAWFNPAWSSFLLRSLLKNADYRNYFIQQAAWLISGQYSAAHVLQCIDRKAEELEPEIDRHLENKRISREHWEQQVFILRDYATRRPAYFMQHIRDEFGTGELCSLRVSISPQGAGKISVNGNPPVNSVNTQYFCDIPLSLEALPDPRYCFDRWSIAKEGPSMTIKGKIPSIVLYFKERPASEYRGQIVFSAIHPAGNAKNGGDWIEIFNRGNEAVSLNQWVFSDSAQIWTLPDGPELGAGESLIICCDTASFRKQYPESGLQLRGNFPKGFSRVSERYGLVDDKGRLVDDCNWPDGRQNTEINGDYSWLAGWEEGERQWSLHRGMPRPGEGGHADAPFWISVKELFIMLIFLMWS